MMLKTVLVMATVISSWHSSTELCHNRLCDSSDSAHVQTREAAYTRGLDWLTCVTFPDNEKAATV